MPAAEKSTPLSTRVVACLGGDATRLEQRTLPPPAEGELLLAVRAVGLCGTDLFKLAAGAMRPGTVLGHELVGIVERAGPATAGFREGDRVAVPHHVPCGACAKCRRGSETLCDGFRVNLMEPGGFSDRVLIRARAVAHAARVVPDRVADDTAVWLEPAACVLRGIERARPAREGLAVVLGAGSMGLLHLLVLRAVLPEMRVLVVDPLPARRTLAIRLGADGASAPGELAPSLAVLGEGLGAEAVFDTVGGARALRQALDASREGGSVVLFAHAAIGERADFDINTLFKHERRVLGTYSGTPREQQRVFELMLDASLDPSPLVTHRMDLAEFARGVALARSHEALKVVFTGAGVAR